MLRKHFYLFAARVKNGTTNEPLLIKEITLSQEEQGKKISQLIARCWSDESFKQKLLADPAATLKAGGVELPAGLSLKAIENTDKVLHLVIPAKPTELSDADLDKVAGGINGLAAAYDWPPGLSF